jgi:hypothetical protein
MGDRNLLLEMWRVVMDVLRLLYVVMLNMLRHFGRQQGIVCYTASQGPWGLAAPLFF